VSSFYTKNMNSFFGRSTKDASDSYAVGRNLILFVGHYDSKRVVSFKAFLKSFKLGAAFKTDKQESFFHEGAEKFPTIVSLDYSVSLTVPSGDPEEAKHNLGRFQEFSRMIKSTQGGQRQNYFRVSLANLIQNGNYSSKKTINSFETVEAVGVLCFINDSQMEIDTEMGFWEWEKGLIPKVFSINLQLLTITQRVGDTVQSKPIIRPLKETGYLANFDKGTWPWGVKSTDITTRAVGDVKGETK
jgi:hypothetical protein